MLQKFTETKDGFYPLFFEKNWQIALLNYFDAQHIDNIDKIDIHFNTDEVFILHKGSAVLITATVEDRKITEWQVEKLIAGIIYNIPANCWHNIAMEKDSSVYIVEKRDTHLGDFEFLSLNDKDRLKLKSLVLQTLK